MKEDGLSAARVGRRAVMGTAIGMVAGLSVEGAAEAATDDPKKARPKAGDRFVFFSGDRKGETIKPEDLPLGGPPMLAYPQDPATETVRSGSRLNQVALIRLDPASLGEDTRPRAADGVLAYSAVCTHQGCPVNMWKEDAQTLYCSCHGSQFDPRDEANVVDGPAPRRLAVLPLKVENGFVVAAGEFEGRIGFK
jgi:rieske iron-sulfur protein